MPDTNNGSTGGSGVDCGTGDDNKRTAQISYNEEERKLRALAGQWKTPPMPAYASAMHARPKQHIMHQHSPPITTSSNDNIGSGKIMTTSSLPPRASLPDNSEEYAKALQEAYRKGAEAAALMAQQQQIPSAASCPNFSTGSSQQQPASSTSTAVNNGITSVDETAMATSVNAFQLDHQIHPPPQQQMSTTIPDPLSSSMPPPLPPSAATSAVHHQHHPHQTQITYASQHLAEQQPFLQPQRSQQQQYHVTTQQQTQMTATPLLQPVTASSAAPRHPKPIKAAASKQSKLQSQQQQPGRSLSMPDMSTYTAEAEDEKRLKRLARNRASARLRRLRKKNLVSRIEMNIYI